MSHSAIDLDQHSSMQRQERLSRCIRERLVEFLRFDSLDEIGPHESFTDLGTDSSQAIAFKIILEQMFDCSLRSSVLFEYPTVQELVQYLDGLLSMRGAAKFEATATAGYKSASLTATAVSEPVGDAFSEPENPRELECGIHGGYPLSETQLGLWFISEALDYAASYHIPLLFRLKQPLDIERWDTAIRAIASRHPSLCVLFKTLADDNQVRQYPVSSDAVLPAYRLADNPGLDSRTAKLAEVRRPFDLAVHPPLRSTYGRDEQGEFVLLVLHHIVVDGLSVAPLVSELWNEYQRRLVAADQAGMRDPASVDRKFWSYLQWEHDYLAGPRIQRDLSYWSERLVGCNGDLGLPRTGNPHATSHVQAHVQYFSPEFTERLRSIARQLKAPLSTLFLASFYLLLSRIGGKDDLAVTTPVSGRPGGMRGDYQHAVGCFINLIVTRVTLDETFSFAEWVTYVRGVFLEGVEHGHLPFARQLQSAGQRVTRSKRGPFPISFTYQNIFEAWLQDAEWKHTVELDYSLFQEVEDELTLEVYDFGEQLQINWKYQPSVFCESAVQAYATAFAHLLEQALEQPTRRLQQFDLASPLTKSMLAAKLDRRAEGCFAPDHVLAWIEQSALQRPNAVAVICDGQQLSYRQLMQASRNHAHQLIAQGVAPGQIVVLPAHRELATLVRLLAILQCGAAYLPIDPATPAIRTSRMIELSQAREVKFEDSLEALTADACGELPTVSPDDLAYVLFTSGSTGLPKGVPIQHGSLVNLCQAMIDLYELQSSDRVLQFASLTFDMSIEEIFPVLCAGGTLVMRTTDELLPERLTRLVHQSGVTIANLPPSYYSALVSCDKQTLSAFFASLRLIAFGGDALPTQVVDDVLQRGLRVLNVYGPTEATVNATAAELFNAKKIHIGGPIRGMVAYIVDDQLRVQPPFVPGELCLAGVGVSIGYLGSQGESNRFTTCRLPEDQQPSRIYRTGDRGYINEQNQIFLLGRNDHQISLRGHRIEPGEVEASINDFPHVVNSIVLEVRNTLYAFVHIEPVAAQKFDLAELSHHLSQRLPAVMVPTKFSVIDRIPQNERGKVDRFKLQQLAEENLTAELAASATQRFGATQQSLPGPQQHHVDPWWHGVSAVLCETLGLHSLLPSDHFFDLGGHSLLAITALGRLNQRFNRQLTLRSFLAAETLGAVATALRDALPAETWTSSLAVKQPQVLNKAASNELVSNAVPASAERGLLSPSQARLWFLDQLGEQSAYLVPAMADVEGEFNIQQLDSALHEIARRHEILRTNFIDQQGSLRQVIRDDTRVPIEVQEFSNRALALAWINQQITSIRFDLSRDPLWRVFIAKFSDHQSVLLICMHHIITDGWSMRILIDELEHYFAIGSLDGLPRLPHQYAENSQEAATRPPTKDALKYWSDHLAGLDENDLETDYPRPATLSSAGGVAERMLDQHLSKRVSQFSRQMRLPPSVLWLAALAVLLRKRRCGEDQLFGIPVAGRSDLRWDRNIGFFVNTLAIRLQLANELNRAATVEAWIRHVASVLADGLQHQEVPIEQILNIVQPERRTDRSPLFQVLFNYASGVPQSFTLGKAILKPLLPESKTAKFELTFSVNEFDSENQIQLAIEFATDLFRESTAQSLLEQWQGLVEQIVDCPSQDLDQLRLTHVQSYSGERSTPETFTEIAESRTAHRTTTNACSFDVAFQQAVQRFGLRTALCVGSQRLTYRELGVQTDARLSQLTGCENVLIAPNRDLDGYLDCLMALRSERPFVFAPELVSVALPLGTAAILPTSGSTGRSKAVAILATSLDAHAQAFIQQFKLSSEDRVAQYATMTFDLFLEELLPALRVGASIHSVPEDVRLDPRALAEWTCEQRITLLDLPTSVFHLLVGEEAACRSLSECLRVLIVGGEELSPMAAAKFSRMHPKVELWNTYGPTEATIICTSHRYDPNVDLDEVPLGLPFANARLSVVDPDGQIVPPGTPGELMIAGPGVAAGYISDGRLRVFEGFRHAATDDTLVYATGDKVVQRLDGCYRFLGRLDDQLKIRGQRVEPSEITELLRSDPRVADAAMVVDSSQVPPQLVAAIVLANNNPVATHVDGVASFRDITHDLANQLSSAQSPRRWLQVDAIPLTPRGKIDRKRIIALANAEAEVAGRAVGPVELTATQQTMLHVWRDVLGHDSITLDDDFFKVGGHSLLAAKLAASIEKLFAIRLPLIDVFLFPTLRLISQRVNDSRLKTFDGPLARFLETTNRNHSSPSAASTIVLMPGLPGLGDLYFPLAEQLRPHANVLLLSLPGFDDEPFPGSLDEVADLWFEHLREISASHAGRTLRVISHSFSGSVLTRLLAHHARALPTLECVVLVDCWPHAHGVASQAMDRNWFDRSELNVIPNAMQVVQAALELPSLSPGQSLIDSIRCHLVVASSSRDNLDGSLWEPYFEDLHVFEFPGDHLSIMRPPDCFPWLERLNIITPT